MKDFKKYLKENRLDVGYRTGESWFQITIRK